MTGASSALAPQPRRRLRIAIIASSHYPVAEPFAGGLEAHVWSLTRALQTRGHSVSLFAAPGSDPALQPTLLPLRTVEISEAARRDVSFDPAFSIDEHHAYLALMLSLGDREDARHTFDVIHNHSLHYLPIAMAPFVSTPLVSTLHTPPTPWLESAIAMHPGCRGRRVRFVGVSTHTARAWRHVTGPIPVIRNGVDLSRWPPGPGGGPLVWSGRIVPEKGTGDAALAARKAGRRLSICGPIVDRAYFERAVAPLLDDQVRYLGHLDHSSLSRVVRHASAALVTPGWDEPYGLVVAEALASGTPVAAYARGGIPEIVDDSCGRLVPAGDVDGLAARIPVVEKLSRRAARRRAEEHCSVTHMADTYEELFLSVVSP